MIVSLEKPPLDTLVHYGVKGMKWGVRKEYQPVGRKRIKKPKLTYYERQRNEYLKRGYSKSDADKLAQRKAKIRHRALIAGGVALAVGTAFAVRHYLVENKDVNLKVGQKAWHISRAEVKDLEPGRHLFVTINQADRIAFRNRLNNPGNVERVERTFEFIKDVKIPSEKESKKLFEEFLKYPEKQKTFKEVFQTTAAFGKGRGDYIDFVATGPYFSSGESWHKRFSNNPKGEQLWNDYKNFLIDKGFQGILDANDRHNAFNVERPSIIFDAASTLREVARKQVPNPTAKSASKLTLREVPGALAVTGAFAGAVSTRSTKNINRVLEAYRLMYPNTNKSDFQILTELNRDPIKLQKVYSEVLMDSFKKRK